MLPTALAPLAAWPQFVAWRIEMRTNSKGIEVPTKVPYAPNGRFRGASSTNPADWGTYEQAIAFQQTHGMDGIGFVFTERDGFFFLDIDKCRVGQGWSQLAQELCARFAGAAIEVSQSGMGLHIIGSCTKGFTHGSRNIPLGLEFYTRERFVALTGTFASGDVCTNLDAIMPAFVEQFFTKAHSEASTEWTTKPVAEWSGPDDDGELLQRAMSSGKNTAASVMGNDKPVTFSDLFTANVDVLAPRWPPDANSGDRFNHSSADQAFANSLAFWTGKNCERMERIMRMSALVRSKWDTRDDYIENTILNACGFTQNVYVQKEQSPPPAPPIEPEEVIAAGFEPRQPLGVVVLAHMQMELFKGCIYIRALNKVLTPDGKILDQPRFNVEYGGYTFALSSDNRATTSSAWTAFTESGHFDPPKADRLCFRPEMGDGGLIETGSLRLANLYRAIDTPRCEGNPGKFLDLMSRQLPVQRDRDILLNYMASVIQNPGMKSQWWPVLQGMKGNGKTVYLTIMRHAVGEQYCHLPNTDKMVRNGMNFNGWIDGKLFLGLEEVHGNNRREFFEGFKTTVTNMSIPIEGKGIEELTGDNRANGMITTNPKAGVPIDRGERRYSVFFTAQQYPGDLQRDGLTETYFADFHDWLYGRPNSKYAEHGRDYGLRVINNYLRNYQTVAELDPARLAIWGPATSSIEDVINSSRGKVEQEVLEAIEEERPGFAGGWVSSIFLDRLLDAKRFNVPVNQRRELMQSIGYDYHPILAAMSAPGRVTSVVQPDGGKPRLYIKNGHIGLNIEEAPLIARAYVEAQSRAAMEKSGAGQVMSK